ncbi:MAG: rRNA maturation RNase YbeY [Bacteroides sp.]|nr:MAG: rRNA maturation RNase YbeY [Bacteroides sp.]
MKCKINIFEKKKLIKNKKIIKLYIKYVLYMEGNKNSIINFIFCSNEYLLKINFLYLNHNHYTDVITFDYSQNNNIVGDIFVSVDMIKYNALLFKEKVDDEFLRVLIHGVLHLCGYNDKIPYDKNIMSKLENHYINTFYKKHLLNNFL